MAAEHTVLVFDAPPVIEPAFAARVRADWSSSLDQLGLLLRGHPVDWANWERDHVAARHGYLRAGPSGIR